MTRVGVAQGLFLRAFLSFTVVSTFVVMPARAAEPECVDAQPTAAAAAEMAARCDRRVEISDRRSENSQSFAKPDGGYTTESSVEPRWSRQPDGSWITIDAELRFTGTTVAPKATALPLVFSGGGAGPAAVLRDGDRELSITWPLGELPKPTLSGPNATYAEVLPGVDLRLTASARGFSELLIVKNRTGAQNSELAQVKFGFATKNVTAASNGAGGLDAKDARGNVVFASPTPLMWESAAATVPLKAAADPPRPPRQVTMPVSVANGELTVTPDAAMMSDTSTRFPLYIDPSWTGRIHNGQWVLVTNKANMAGQGFWQGGFLQEADKKGAVGTGLICDFPGLTGGCTSGTTYNVRSYFKMDTSFVKGRKINGASFRIQQMWASHCNNGGSNATARWTNDIDGTTTWNNQPGWMGDEWAASVPANHKHTSEHNCAGTGDVEFDIRGVVQAAADNNRDVITLVLHVGDENDTGQWKRFNAITPVLSIDYNTPPDAPDNPTSDLKPCTTKSFVPTVTPTLRAHVNDKDGDPALQARFEWARVREDGTYTPVSEVRDTYPWGSNTIAQTTIPTPANLDDGVLDRSETLVATGDWDNDGHPDVIARDSGGYLYLFPGNGRLLRTRVLLSGGWKDYTFVGVTDWDNDGKKDIIARHDPTGELHMFAGNGVRATLPEVPPAKIGFGFGGYQLAGLADFDKDGKQDLIARDGNGELWLYPGEGTRTVSGQVRARIGGGFGPYTFYGIIDRTGDGAPDIIAEYDNRLWLYPGSGKRSIYTGTPGRHEIGSGWAGARALTIPDVNGDGAVDVVAHLPGWTSWQLYPGMVGTGYGGQQWPMAGVGLTDGGVYVFRVTAGDWQVWGPSSGWCGFSVDTTKPDAPTFTSSVYKTSGCAPEGCGALGVADTLSFASTSTDVEYFRWGFTDPPSMRLAKGKSVRWTPPSSGPKTLFVEAVDYAGLATRSTFDFTVTGDKPIEAQWFTADDPAFDETGHGHGLALTGLDTGRVGRAVGGMGAIGFDGTVTNGATTAKVLDTGKDFSVSAWVRLTGDTVNRTVVSQQGASTSAFQLGYDAAEHRWVFALAETDAANAQLKTAKSDAPAAGVWTHLTGTFDSVNKDVRLYVDGALQRKSDVVKDGFAAGGQVWIGKAMRNSVPAEPWLGDVAEVRAWNRAITPQETLKMADASEVGAVGRWLFDEGTGSVAEDDTQFRRALKLNLAGGARWGEGINGRYSLELNGANGSASTNECVLNTDQSFSVDVWAKLNGTGTPRTVVVQRGPSGVDPFTLKYDGSQWSAEMPNAAVNPSTWWKAKGDAVVNKWTHLVATYDAGTRTLKLSIGYKANDADVDAVDVLKSTVTGVVGWNSTGVLSVGRSSAGEYFTGNIDELQVFQGVIALRALETQARQGSSLSGDARDEIISVDANGGVRAFLNVSDASVYPGAAQVVGSGFAADRTWFADINGDGKSEIIGVDSSGAINAFKNVNGMNGFPFGEMSVIGSVSGETSRIRFADIDGDGRADRVSIDDDGRVRVYRNLFGLNELGQTTAFATTPVIVKVLAPEVTSERVWFADVNGDKKAEFITVNVDKSVSAFRNFGGLGYGSYDTSQDIGSGWTPDRTWFADINGDGKAEIISVRTDGTVWSFRNVDGLDGRTGFPYSEEPKQVGSGWFEPARVFFS